jgi:hypothetical protein
VEGLVVAAGRAVDVHDDGAGQSPPYRYQIHLTP